ncbi:MAG: AMP-binding protein, partial [Rhodoferax sp.]|nr:AMP-binding protein [Rhodoferax sp.]
MTPSQVPAWPQHLPYEIDIPECNLCWHLVASATRYPSRAALIDERGVISYSELLHAVERMAGHFQHAFSLAAGERVLLYMPNSREWIIAYYAILYCSAIVVPVNPMYRNAELQPVLKETEPVIAVCSDKGLAEVKLAVAGQTLRGIVGSGQVLSHAENGPAPTPLVHEPDRLALILYSSGSTGVPKGCMHTHRTLNASTVIVAQWMWMAPASIHLVALPFFHITGMQNLLNAPIFSGATLVLMERWSRERAGELIARHHVSHWTAMPTMLIDFLESAQFREFDLSSIRRVGGGGAGMPQAVGERIKEMTGMDFLEGYGLSETAHVTGNPPHAFKRQCLGMPLFNTDVRVIDPESLDELPPGQ